MREGFSLFEDILALMYVVGVLWGRWMCLCVLEMRDLNMRSDCEGGVELADGRWAGVR